MKLLARTNSYYIFFSVITYILIAGGFYFSVEYVIYRDVEERLTVERRDFEQFIQTHPQWNEDLYFVEGKIHVEKWNASAHSFPAFKDTLLYNRYSNQLVPFREHSFICTIGTDRYKVSIRKSLIESNRLLTFITGTMLLLLSIGLTLLFLFQRRISKKIWKPFYETLSQTKSFDVTEGKNLQLPGNIIHEFNELNIELNKMTDKISRDYRNLKEFTENASHEIQTPLALINSRIEDIIQDRSLSSSQMSQIQDIYECVMRLSKLNKALLLLSKIENGQFYELEEVNISALIGQKVTEFEEMIRIKGLTLKYERLTDCKIIMNPALAEILVTNLMKNAVKHNLSNGSISIMSQTDKIMFENTGHELKINTEMLYERFKKQNQSSGSLGLGLAIVKKICAVTNLKTEYHYWNGLHRVTLELNS